MAWTVFLYVFTAIVGGLFIFYAFFKPKKPKGAGNSPLHRYKAALKTLPLGTKNGWELIGIEHGLRLWERNGSEEGSVFASSMILPISLKVLVKMLIDPSQMLEWDPWVKTVSRISVSNEKSTESFQDSGDVVSLTVAPNSSSKFLEAVDILTSLFKNDPKICSRTWHHEVNTEFWLHSASVEPHSSDPLYSLMMVFPLKKTNEECEVIIFSEGMVGFNPCSLTSKLAGLQEYIVHHHSEAVYPEIKGQEEDSVIDEEEKVFEEAADGDIGGRSTQPPSEVFVDVSGVYLRPEKDVQAKYKVAIDHAIKLLMIHYNAKAGENGWYLVGKVKNVEILKKPASPGFSIWDCSKGTIVVNVPVHYLLAYCNDLNHNSDYDDMFHAGHIIESVGELTNVVYSEYKAIWPVSGRDFSAFNATRVLPDSIYVTVARSIKHPSCPSSKKYVRGKIIIGGFVMKELSKDPPRVLLTYITHVDLAGSVPSRIVNKVTANQPLSVGIVKQCVEKMYQEMLDNPDGSSEFKTKAMTYLGKLERAKNMMQNAKIVETSEAPVEQEPAQAASESVMNGGIRRSESLPRQSPRGIHSSSSVPQFHSPKMKFSSCDDVHIDYKTIGNQACAGLLQEVFEVAEVDITKTVGSSGTVSEQWEYRGTEKEVMMFRKVHANEKMHSFIGKGIMPCSPPRVWEVLKEPKHRYQYDNMLKETRVLEKINDSIIIQYLHFEAANCFKKQSRDFIALRTARKEKDKYLISFVSVDYRDCPEKKDIKRGKIIASGWVVEPLLHNGQLFSMVTYLAQFNPGGSYPASLVNFVARKQPLCVAYLKKYLENPNIAQTDFSDSS